MSETRWWWIRHAPVTGHEGRVYGASDVPCDVSARDVFQRLAGRLPADALWVTSHLQRTSQTAEAIRTEMSPEQAATPLPVARLAEQNFGDWQGMSRADLAERRDGAWHRFWLAPAHERPPGGESFEDVVERVSKSITELTEQHRGRDIIAVTHGGTNSLPTALLPVTEALKNLNVFSPALFLTPVLASLHGINFSPWFRL